MKKTNDINTTKNTPKDEQVSRRTFIKKAVYVAPTLIALGSLTRPTDAEAGFGKPPSGPTW